MKKILLTFIALSTSLLLPAQGVLNSAYNLNRFLLSPAQAGNQGDLTLMTGSSSLFGSVPGSPERKYLAVDGAINESFGLGGIVNSRSVGRTSLTEFNLSFAYRLKVTEESMLSFGLQTGLNNVNVNLSDVNTGNMNDQTLISPINQGNAYTYGFGINYSFKGLEVGGGMNRIAGSDVNFTSDNLTYSLNPDYFGYANYTYEIKKDTLSFQPALVLNGQQNSPMHVNAMLQLTYLNKYWGGVRLGSQQNHALVIGLHVLDNLSANYAYNFSNSDLAQYASGGHEIGIIYRIGEFGSKSAQPNPEQEAKVDSVFKQNEYLVKTINGLKDQNNVVLDLKADMKKLNARVERLTEQNLSQKDSIARLNSENIVQRDSIRILDNKVNGVIKASGIDPNTIAEEKDLKNYILVVASHPDSTIAKMIQSRWMEKGYESGIMRSASKSWYYIYVADFDNREEGQVKLNELYNQGLEKVWLYENKVTQK